MKIISGKKVSQEVKDGIKEKIDYIKNNSDRRLPQLTVIIVGENPASKTYVRNKEKACEYVGIKSEIIRLPEDTTENELLAIVDKLNFNEYVDGILVQLPLPKHINEDKVLNAINPSKDVDGFHPLNASKLLLGQKGFVPCTPKGIIRLIDSIDYDLDGKHVVVVGRSNIVGKPVALLCLQRNATVTIAHSHTKDLERICKSADVLICAVGKPKFFDYRYIRKNAVVIDVGINRDENGKLCGDVDFNPSEYEDYGDYCLPIKIQDKIELPSGTSITPVPGGVGPMTIAMLLENTMEAYEMH